MLTGLFPFENFLLQEKPIKTHPRQGILNLSSWPFLGCELTSMFSMFMVFPMFSTVMVKTAFIISDPDCTTLDGKNEGQKNHHPF